MEDAKKVYVTNCPKHGKRYPLASNSTLCAHPKCLETIVWNLGYRSSHVRKIWAEIKRSYQCEDAIQYLAMRFLDEFSRGKDPIFSVQWTYFSLLKFRKAKYLNPTKEVCYPTPMTDEEVPESWDDALKEHFAAIDETADPFTDTLIEEVTDYMLDNEQALTLLHLRGDLTTTDVWRVQHAETQATFGDTENSLDFSKSWAKNWAKQLSDGPEEV